MRWLSKTIVFGLMVKTMTGYIPSEMDMASTIGFGLNSEKSYIIQPVSNGGGSKFRSCIQGMPYGILAAITENCTPAVPVPPPTFRPCSSGMSLGLLLSITCGP